MVKPQYYQHIWDCCCDHGLLGFALLPQKSSNNAISPSDSVIHFVDIVPDLILEIEDKLQRFYSVQDNPPCNNSLWQTHCLDVAKLPLAQHEGKHLVIIAGVGGDLMIKFIQAIHQQYKDFEIDFLLCPVHHQYSLRSKLIELDFSFQDEMLLEENKRFYEILLVSSQRDVGISTAAKVHQVGNKIWQPLVNNEDSLQADIANRYLTKTLKHYRRIKQGIEQSLQQKVSQDDIQDTPAHLIAKQNSKTAEYLQVQEVIQAYNKLLPQDNSY